MPRLRRAPRAVRARDVYDVPRGGEHVELARVGERHAGAPVLRLVGDAGRAAVDVYHVRRAAHEETRVTKRVLFTRLCAVADAIQAECVRGVDFSPHQLALEAILDGLDVLIDDVIDMRTETLEEDDAHG